MKLYELKYIIARPFISALNFKINSILKKTVNNLNYIPKVLDVGARKSPTTIGINAEITLSDLVDRSEVQKKLNLGFQDSYEEFFKKNRNNISATYVDDMVKTNLKENSYDIIISIEVLEHVLEDEKFIINVKKILKKDGCFVMSTPNGDFKKNTNPDHVRHYTKKQLESLLQKHFNNVDVYYAIKDSNWRKIGITSVVGKSVFSYFKFFIANFIKLIESSSKNVKTSSHGTAHLIAEVSN
jgi:SAM-dependent methyltransferase